MLISFKMKINCQNHSFSEKRFKKSLESKRTLLNTEKRSTNVHIEKLITTLLECAEIVITRKADLKWPHNAIILVVNCTQKVFARLAISRVTIQKLGVN